jgi:predicted DNA-binding transcriptional regulator YafY
MKNTHSHSSALALTPTAEQKSQEKESAAPRRITRLGFERMIALDARFRHNFYSKDPDLKYPDAEELGVELGVNEKAIREDIQMMHDRLGLPCRYIAKHRGYGYTEEVTSFPLTHLTRSDIVYFCGAWNAIRSFRGLTLSNYAGDPFEKVLRGLDYTHSLDPNKVRSLISFRPSTYYSVVDPTVFQFVASALLDQEELRFTYTKLTDTEVDRIYPNSPSLPAGPSERRVQPRHLACIECSWYLFCDDVTHPGRPSDKSKRRTFALSRMSDVIRTDRRFIPTDEFDIDQELDSAFGPYSGGEKFNLRVRFRNIGARLIAERRYDDTIAILYNPDGSIDLVRRVSKSPQVPNWILSFGEDAEVISPKFVQDDVNQIIRKLYARLPGAMANEP